MKRYIKFLKLSLFAALIVLAGCGGDDEGDDTKTGVTAAEELVNKLVADGGNWSVVPGGVELESVPVPGWENFSVQFAGNVNALSYTTMNSGEDRVWPSRGSLTITEGSDDELTRSDDIIIKAKASETNLVLTFTIAEARTNGIKGSWSFSLAKQ